MKRKTNQTRQRRLPFSPSCVDLRTPVSRRRPTYRTVHSARRPLLRGVLELKVVPPLIFPFLFSPSHLTLFFFFWFLRLLRSRVEKRRSREWWVCESRPRPPLRPPPFQAFQLPLPFFFFSARTSADTVITKSLSTNSTSTCPLSFQAPTLGGSRAAGIRSSTRLPLHVVYSRFTSTSSPQNACRTCEEGSPFPKNQAADRAFFGLRRCNQQA